MTDIIKRIRSQKRKGINMYNMHKNEEKKPILNQQEEYVKNKIAQDKKDRQDELDRINDMSKEDKKKTILGGKNPKLAEFLDRNRKKQSKTEDFFKNIEDKTKMDIKNDIDNYNKNIEKNNTQKVHSNPMKSKYEEIAKTKPLGLSPMPKDKEYISHTYRSEPKFNPVPVNPEDSLGEVRTKTDLMKIASFVVSERLLPSSFDSKSKVFIALQTAFSLGVKSPGEMLLALNNMYIIQNKIELFGDLPLSLVRRYGDLLSIEEFFVDSDHNKICLANKNLKSQPMSAICLITTTTGVKQEFFLSDDDLILSGGIRMDNGGWKFNKGSRGASQTWLKYPKIHWTRRLRAWALKTMYPHILKGVSIHEYDNLKNRDKGTEVSTNTDMSKRYTKIVKKPEGPLKTTVTNTTSN